MMSQSFYSFWFPLHHGPSYNKSLTQVFQMAGAGVKTQVWKVGLLCHRVQLYSLLKRGESKGPCDRRCVAI